MFKNLTSEEVAKMATRVGHETSRQYPGVDAYDIASEALTRLYEKARRLADVEAGYVYRVLERDAQAYAAKVRYDSIIETSQYVYTPREVKALLAEVYFDPAAWDVPTGPDDWLSAEIEGRSIGISLMDIREGMERIKPAHRDTLERKYFRQEEIHREELSRAVDSLTRAVNRIAAKSGESDEGPGSREVMSMSKSLYITNAEMGHERNPYEKDALVKLQKERRQERSDPPGTHFNWDKYKN